MVQINVCSYPCSLPSSQTTDQQVTVLTAFSKQEKKKRLEKEKDRLGFCRRAGRGRKGTEPPYGVAQVTKEEVMYIVELNVLFY